MASAAPDIPANDHGVRVSPRPIDILAPVVAVLSLLALTLTLGASMLVKAGPGPVLAVHVTCSLAIAGVAWLGRRDPNLLGRSLMLAALILIGGALGGAIWIALLLISLLRRPQDAGTTARAVRPDDVEALQQLLLDRRLRIEGSHVTRSLRDVFVCGTQPEKLRALSSIARRYDVSLAPALRTALKDGDPAVRVLASSVLTTLEARFLRRVRAASKDAQRDAAPPAAWSELAEAFVAYADSGLLRADRRGDALRRAEDARSRAALGAEPGQAAARVERSSSRLLTTAEG